MSDKADPGDLKQRLMGQSVLVELGAFALEIVAALLSNSLSLYADIAKELVDMLATLVSWLTLRQLRKYQHAFDFGFGKVESLLSVVVAGGLLISVYAIFSEALKRLASPKPLESIGFAFFINAAWIGVEGLYWRKLRRADRDSPSPVLEAKWKSFRAGSLVCAGLAATLVVSKLLEGHSWALYIDPIVSIGFSIYILWTAGDLVVRALGDLTDRTLDEAAQLAIVRELGQFFDEYEQFHGVRSRRSGGNVDIELYLEFHPELRVREVLAIAKRMRTSLESKIRHSRVVIVPAQEKPG
jgi:ferrous-iron efflux pump FieF